MSIPENGINVVSLNSGTPTPEFRDRATCNVLVISILWFFTFKIGAPVFSILFFFKYSKKHTQEIYTLETGLDDWKGYV